jgi:hypothetical protein
MIAFVIGLFAVVLVGLQQILGKAELSIKNSLAVVAFMQEDLSDTDASALSDNWRSQDPEIVSIRYLSKEQAYQEAVKDPNLAKSLVLLKSNPLPASFTLQFSDRAWLERAEPAEKLKASGNIQEIRWDPQAHALFRSIRQWRSWAMRFSAFVGILLAVWAFIGLYRVLALHGAVADVLLTLALGALGGILAWGLWGLGLKSIHADVSPVSPVWVWLVPVAIGVISALGCFGLEVRDGD